MITQHRCPVALLSLGFDDVLRETRKCITLHEVSKNRRVANPGNCRTLELAEKAKLVFPESCHTSFSPSMTQAFVAFLRARSEFVNWSSDESKGDVSLLDPLSFLLVKWRDSLFDGAGMAETHGYLDEDCMPGWDSWVAIVELPMNLENALLCWVPPELCRDVDRAISIDAAKCMSWLTFDDNSMVPITVGWGKPWRTGGMS